MKRRSVSTGWRAAAAFLMTFSFLAAAQARTAEKDSPIEGKGRVLLSSGKYASLDLQGYSPDLGDYSCYGEVSFFEGADKGERDAEGVAVFKTASGDQIVGDVQWVLEPDGTGEIEFIWRDSVQFSDGSVGYSTGVFDKKKPKNGKGKTQEVYLQVKLMDLLVSSY